MAETRIKRRSAVSEDRDLNIFSGDKDTNLTLLGDLVVNTDGSVASPGAANAAVAGGKSYYLDGTSDYIEVADDDDLDFGTGDFSIEMIVRPGNITDTNKYLINKENGGVGYGLQINNNDLKIRMDDNSGDASGVIARNIFEAGVPIHLLVTFDRSGNATAHANGVAVGTRSLALATSTISSAGVLRIGTESGGTTGEFTGDVYMCRLYNNLPTAAEILTLAQGGPLPFKYIGANQTEILNEGNFASHANWDHAGTADDWLDTGGNATYTWSGFGNSTLTQTAANQAAAVAPAGNKAVRFQYDLAVTTPFDEAGAITITAAMAQAAESVDLTAGTAKLIEFITADAPADFVMTAVSSDDTEGTLVFDNFSLLLQGCVLNLEQKNIGALQWADTNGSNNNGTVTGALAQNLPIGHTEQWFKVVSANTSFNIPIGFRILSGVVVETAGNALTGGLDMGLTTNGVEIVSGQAVSGSATVDLVLVQTFFSTTAVDEIFFSDGNDNTDWDSAVLDVWLILQKVI